MQADSRITKSAEKAVRLPEDHPRRIAFANHCPKRLKRDNWRDKATELMEILPRDIALRIDIRHFTTNPWMEAKAIPIHPELEGVNSRHDNELVKREVSLRKIREVNAPTVVYTDGSAHRGIRWGGTAAVMTEEDPTVLDTVSKRGHCTPALMRRK